MDTITDPSADLAHLRTTGFITDGGLETTLVFHEGLDLPDFAAFPLLDDESGRVASRCFGCSNGHRARRLSWRPPPP